MQYLEFISGISIVLYENKLKCSSFIIRNLIIRTISGTNSVS